MTPFAERSTEFIGLRKAGECTLKTYSVVYGSGRLDSDRFAPGVRLALEAVPPADPSRGRPGLGFLVLHQGRTGDYVVVCWWDNENELPTRVFVRSGASWRAANANESFCVWDLKVMWFERNAYIETMLSGEPSAEAYVERSLRA